MGHIYWQANQQEQAMATWLQAYAIAKQIGFAQALAALESMGKQLGGEGLTPEQVHSKSKPCPEFIEVASFVHQHQTSQVLLIYTRRILAKNL